MFGLVKLVVFLSLFYGYSCERIPSVDLHKRAAVPFKINVCSWNVGGHNNPGALETWLGLHETDKPDIISIGLQEVNDDSEWKGYLLDILSNKDYVMVKHRKMNWIVQYLFVRRDHITQTSNIESETTATGLANLVGNKGGVSIRLDFYGTNLIFVNSHLASDQDKVQDRIDDYERIMKDQKFRDSDVNTIMDHKYVFWLGDLNFRIDDMSKGLIEEKIAAKELKFLQHYDQLNKLRASGRIFQQFSEGDISFPPTYKFDPGTDMYDSSTKNRRPAWTDRVLWKTSEGVKLNLYTSYKQYRMSDHRPIRATFTVMFPSSGQPLPITFSNIPDIKRRGDNFEFRYDCASNLELSTWDWIAIYRESFSNFDDYEAWVRPAGCGKVMKFDKDVIAGLNGRNRLGYFSKSKNAIAGYSNLFNVS